MSLGADVPALKMHMFTFLYLNILVFRSTAQSIAASTDSIANASAAWVFTEKNRCHFYPRCLLFGCCPEHLLQHYQQHDIEPSRYPCMHRKDYPTACSLGLSLQERIRGHPFLNANLTRSVVQTELLALPVTTASDFKQLQNKWYSDRFRVLFLVQSNGLEQLNCLGITDESASDCLILTWKQPVRGSFFFSGCKVGEGRNALYLAGRVLELQQGRYRTLLP